MQIRHLVERIIGSEWLAVVYPRICPVCRSRAVPDVAEVCHRCDDELFRIPSPQCSGCGGYIDGVLDICSDCTRDPRPWRRAYSVFKFDGLARQAIHRFKYHGDIGLTRFLGRSAYEHWRRHDHDDTPDFIIPVPLHRLKRIQRGYNQSELLAQELGRLCGIPIRSVLRRTKWTKPQASLTRAQRRHNLKSAFAAKSTPTLKERNLMIVDDVFTTGSTLHACADQLITNGAATVEVLTIARG